MKFQLCNDGSKETGSDSQAKNSGSMASWTVFHHLGIDLNFQEIQALLKLFLLWAAFTLSFNQCLKGNSLMSILRTFIAIEIERQVSSRVNRFVNQLGKLNPDVQWNDCSQLHITLCFLGEIHLNQSLELTRIAQDVAETADPIELHIETFGGFPNLSSPRVLWIGAKEPDVETGHLSEAALLRKGMAAFCPALTTLSEKLVQAFLNRQYTPDTKSFRPHITVGRIAGKKGNRILDVPEALIESADTGFGQQWVRRLRVLSSEQTAKGPVYRPISTIEL